MSPENMEAVRRAYRGVSARLEPPRELFGAGYEVDPTEFATDIGVVQGFDGMQEAFRPYWETFDGFHIEVDELIDVDEKRVFSAVRDGGRMKGSGAEVWNRFFHVWTFRDGKIVRLSIHNDRDRALEAAGLSG